MVTLTWGGVSERGNTWLYLFTSSLDLEKQATYVGIVYGGRNGGRSVYRTHLRILDDQKAVFWDQESWLLDCGSEYLVRKSPKEFRLFYESLVDGMQHLHGLEIFGWIP